MNTLIFFTIKNKKRKNISISRGGKMVTCPICGANHFKDKRGLQGHLNFKHGYARQTPVVKAINENIKRRKEGKPPLWVEEMKEKERKRSNVQQNFAVHKKEMKRKKGGFRGIRLIRGLGKAKGGDRYGKREERRLIWE